MEAVPRVQVRETSSHVDGEGDPQAPGEREVDVVDVGAQVPSGEVLGDDEDALGGGRGTGGGQAETEVLDNVGVSSLLHDLALSLEVLVDCSEASVSAGRRTRGDEETDHRIPCFRGPP